MNTPDIRDFQGQRVHMIGIGGASMSGLAEMLRQEGYVVTGTDRAESDALEALRSQGIDARAGHHPEGIAGAAMVVYSAAIHEDDPERREASRLNIPQMERAVLLGQLMRGYGETVCVCGTHGKTTLSAMIAKMLTDCGRNPTVHIGGRLDAIGGGTRIGARDVFVAEACEFNRSFLHMPPTLAVLTNIEEDHLDCYGDMAHLEQAFSAFLNLLPEHGAAIGLADDERVMRVFNSLPRPTIAFGMGPDADWTMRDLAWDAAGCTQLTACFHGQEMARVALSVAGKYNALHALAALAAAHRLGVDMAGAARSLAGFTGVHRRFEHTGVVKGMLMYTDYGHNPAEMAAALSVARQQGRRLIAVMQPHTFSRVKSQFDAYLTCTKEADITLVTDIYAAREQDPGDIHSGMLVDGMRRHGIDAHLTGTFDQAEQWLLNNGREGDLVLTMSCGDIHLLNQQMQRHWDARQPATTS
jgi:UDP-N-acetylmuramate--alanine ligase